jgi:hypothetical protein
MKQVDSQILYQACCKVRNQVLVLLYDQVSHTLLVRYRLYSREKRQIYHQMYSQIIQKIHSLK